MPVVGDECRTDEEDRGEHPSVVSPHCDTDKRNEQNEKPSPFEGCEHGDREQYRTSSEKPPAHRRPRAIGAHHSQREHKCHDLLEDNDRIPRRTYLSSTPVRERY